MSFDQKIFDINEFDKSTFKCIKFSNTSIYYGQIAYFDLTTNKEVDIDDIIAKEDPERYTKKRQGAGVQIFHKPDNTIISKYEGMWVADKMQGEGVLLYPDQSLYAGKLVDGQRNGIGRYVWASGDTYDGNWKSNKMHGLGCFKKAGDLVMPYDGYFRNNYFNLGGDNYINPFYTAEEIEAANENRSKYQLQLEIANKKKEQLFKVSVVDGLKKVLQKVWEVYQRDRVPLVLSEKATDITLQEFVEENKLINPDLETFVLDMRHIKESQKRGRIDDRYAEIKNGLARCIAKGGLFIVNMDDSDVSFEDTSEPDIKEFYNSRALPSQLLEQSVFRMEGVYKRVLQDTEWADENLNDGFMVIVWSRFKVDASVDYNAARDMVERRLGILFDISRIHLLVANSL